MNHLTNVYSIVPRLPPAIDGVGDYALNLARQLRKDFNIQTHFIVGNPTWSGESEIEGFAVSQIRDRTANKLVEILSSDRSCSIVLHYSGYGYAQRGCPVWLIDGLQRWKSSFPNRSLVTMFHELYASGAPWTSSFWLSPLQKNLVARLARLSDRGWASQQQTTELLSQLTSDKLCPITSLPVFSNISESSKIDSLVKRSQKMIIFGTYGRRLPIYQNSTHILNQIVRDLDIREILDIGKPLSLHLKQVGNVSIISLGEQPALKINSYLQESIVGIIDYPTMLLAKSTIFATYCAYGILPVVVGSNNFNHSEMEIDGLIAGKHYWLSTTQSNSLNMEIAQTIADNAYNWYKEHNLSVHAQTFASLLSGC